MSTLLPLQPASPPRRAQVATSTQSEHRADGGQGRFADSFANACAPSRGGAAAADAEAQTPGTPRDTNAQRAQVHALLLNGFRPPAPRP